MTTDRNFKDRNRDIQDAIERHIFERLEYVDGAGAVVKVNGTGTTDDEVPVLVVGYGFNLPEGFNAEVLTMSDGSDMTGKFALMTLPRDKQRKWGESRGGVQNPIDPDKALEFNEKRAHIREKNAAIGDGGIFEVIGDTVYIRGNLNIDGDLNISGDLGVKGDLMCEGEGRFNGDLSSPFVRNPDGNRSNLRASVNADVPDFQDVD